MTDQSDAALLKILEESPIGAAIFGRNTIDRLYVNKTLANMFGMVRGEDLIEKDISESWANQDEFNRAVSVFQSGQILINFEAERKRVDGSRWWVLMNTQPVEFEGKDASVIWHIDITERKQAEQNQHESEKRFRHAFEDSPVGMVMTTPDGTRFKVNQALADFLGYTVEELTNTDIRSAIADKTALDRTEQLRQQVIDGEISTFRYELSYLHKDGHTVWGEATGSLFRNEAGEPEYFVAHILDITRRKAAQERSERLRTAINQLTESVVIFDEDDRVVIANDAWLKLNNQIAGYTRPGTRFEDQLRAGMENGLIPESEGHEEEWLHERMKRHRNPTGPFVVARQEGRWIKVHEQRLADGGTILVTSDISELKQSEAQFREVFDNSPIGIGIVTYNLKASDLAGQRLLTNPALVQMLGATNEEELKEQKIEDSWVDLDQLRVAKKIMEDRKELVDFEVARRRLDGTEWWSSMSSRPILFDGQPCIMTWLSDITERKQAEEALRASEAQLEGILKIAPEAVIVVGPDHNIRLFNQSAERLFGYTTDEVLGQSLNKLLPPYFHRVNNKYIDGFSESQEAFLMMDNRKEISAIRKDGSIFPAAASISKLEINGENIFVALLQDITNSKKAEDELLASRENAERANRAKSEFLANMSHEIRTPMNGVIGMVDILTQMDMEPEQKRMIQTIRNSSFALLRIIDDILDASKIEAGKLELESVPVQLHQIIEGVIETLIPTADTGGVRLTLFIDPTTPKWIHSDAGRLRQVMLNLVSNAIKFSRRKDGVLGQVHYQIERADENTLKLTVKDDGIGMTEDVRSKLFKPFSQGEESTTRKFGGTGLGLVISHNLIEMMGGTLTVDSTPGQGSTFTVMLPIVDAEGSIKNPNASGLKLLALVDDLMRRYVISEYATHSGSTIRYADNEAELTAWVEAEKGEVIILLALGEMAENTRIQETLENTTGQRRFLIFTPGRSDKMGLVHPNCYVIQRLPVLPTDFLRGLAILSGRENPDVDMPVTGLGISSDTLSTEEAETRHRLILLVEDNLTNQEVIMYQLELLGYAAEVADDGQQGLKLYETGRFDLVLSDCHMPIMDGFEMTEMIRQFEKKNGFSRIPIVAITANALQGEADRCLTAGMDDYLSKPVELKRLGRTLERWLPVSKEKLRSH